MSDIGWLLLCDPSPSLRYRVLTELLQVPDDDPETADLAARRDGSSEVRALVEAEASDLRERSWLLCRFASLGLDRSHPRVRELAEEILGHQLVDGSFPLSAFRSDDRYSMIPLQVALPLRGLAAAGYATDPRVERSYEWLLDARLDDGAWPTGWESGHLGYVAGYRRLPGSTGCRANTQAALACLALHPSRRQGEEARAALNLLLRRESREEWALGTEVSRLTGTVPAGGFFTFYARFDLALLLELASRVGASTEEQRVAGLVDFLLERRNPAGLWPHPAQPQLTRWLSFEIELSLRRLERGDLGGADSRAATESDGAHA